MRRFQTDKRSTISKNLVVSVVFFLFLLLCFGYGIQSVATTADRAELETLEDAVRRNVIQCYAAEGRYPENIEYLEEHYALHYDKENILSATKYSEKISCLISQSNQKQRTERIDFEWNVNRNDIMSSTSFSQLHYFSCLQSLLSSSSCLQRTFISL